MRARRVRTTPRVAPPGGRRPAGDAEGASPSPPQALGAALPGPGAPAAGLPASPPASREARAGCEAGRSDARETAEIVAVAALFVLAAGAVWFALAFRGGRDGAPGRAPAPSSVVPRRVPYADLVRGRVRPEGAAGRVELLYDFEPLPEGWDPRFLSDLDRYPQIADWNIGLPGFPCASGVVKSQGRLLGSARLRVSFAGDVSLGAKLELRSGSAHLILRTNAADEGLELAIESAEAGRAAASLRLRRLVPAGEAAPFGGRRSAEELDVSVLLGPVGLDPSPVGREVAVELALDRGRLTASIEGAQVLSCPAPEGAPEEGNVTVASSGGSALWDDVRIRGAPSPGWIERRMADVLSLILGDAFEPDDVWAMARELAADGSPQERTLGPDGDVDWILVAAPRSAFTRVETLDLHMGIDTELALFEADGRTPLLGSGSVRVPAVEDGAEALLVETGGRKAFFARVSEREGRKGTYSVRASAVGGF